jgi:ATP/maltotriose-dependent transcriptional regulator MalT
VTELHASDLRFTPHEGAPFLNQVIGLWLTASGKETSRQTVKTHTNSMFGKLQVTSRTQAIVLARDLQLL